MDRIHYEVAVLAHYESQNSGLLGENDPLMNQDVALQSQQSLDAEPPSAPTRPKQDKEPDWFNPMEYLIDAEVKECTSGGVTDYISAQEQFQDFDPEDFADFLNPSLGDLDGKDVESNFIGKEKSFMGKLTDKLSNIDQKDRENVKGDLDSNAESDVDSEAYFSAASQPVEEGIPRRAKGPLSTSSSDCYSRESSVGCYSRSSSVGYSSRSSSISRSRLTNDQSSDEEVNFGDVDSFSVLSMPFSIRRKKQLRMRKSCQELGTIFSPSFKHGDFVVTKGKESESESFSIDFTNTELTSTFLTGPSGSGQSCPSSTGQSGSDSVFVTGLTESSSGNATESSLNPLCSPFVPRAMNRSVFNYTTTSQTDSDCPLENFTPLIPTDDSGFGTSNRTADQSQFVNRNLQVEKNSTSEPDSTEVILTDRLVAAEQIKRREFDCKVQHNDDEFFSLKDLSISNIPTDYQNTSWETITSMSHRVVRIRVTKTSNIVKSEDSSGMNSAQRLNPEVSDKCVHFGSGFAHYVDENFVEIRTHSKVVSTADDVENTVVTFSLTKSTGVSVDIDLKGERGSLHYNKYDRSTVFRCKSKGILEGYLHLFVDVPILRQTSSFQDSDYFSEESSSCSSNHSTKLESYLNDAEDLQRCEETVLGVIGSLGIIDTTIIKFSGQDNTEEHSATGSGTCENLSNLSTAETANTANVLESNSNPFQYNISRLNELQQSAPSSESNSKSPSRFPSLSIPVPALEQIAKEEVPSPLRVMEKRKSKINPGVCPYTDQSPDFVAEYKPFSSFASKCFTLFLNK